MSKPTKAYLELMAKLQQRDAENQRILTEEAMEKAQEKRVESNNAEQNNAVLDKKNKEQKAAKAYGEFTTAVKSELLENVLTNIVQKSMPTVINESKAFMRSVIREFINNEGAYNLINKMRGRTEFLNELADDIDDAYSKEIEDVDAKEPDTFVANKTPNDILISKLDDSDDLEDATDIIRQKVSRATDEFIERNVMNQTEIKSTLQDARRRMEEVRTGDDTVDEEIRQEASTMAKRKVNEIRQRPHTVFEQLVTNIAEAVVKNEDLKKEYTTESGKLDMDNIVSKATTIYTVMETLNTLKFKDFDTDSVLDFIQFG